MRVRVCIFVRNFLLRHCARRVRVRVCIFVRPFLVRCVCFALNARRVKLHVLIALDVSTTLVLMRRPSEKREGGPTANRPSKVREVDMMRILAFVKLGRCARCVSRARLHLRL